MATHYGDYQGFVTSEATAYPISYSAAGLFDMSPLAAELMDFLPSYYFLGNNNRRILELIATVLKKYADSVDDFINQLFVETATWGLKYWEQLVGCTVNEDSLDYESRRICVLNKLRDCSSEECFIEGMERIVAGEVIAMELPPATNPYQVRLDLRSDRLTYLGPKSFPSASAFGTGPLEGDYTYRVTYEFDPIVIPNYITLFSYTNSYKSLFNQGNNDVIPHRQYLRIFGSGSFYLTLPGIDGSAGPFTETSDASSVVDLLRDYLEPRYGVQAVDTPFGTDIVGENGIILVFNGPTTNGLKLPLFKLAAATGTISSTITTVNDPQFVLPEIHAETSSGVVPEKTNEVQVLGQGLFNPAIANAPFESDLFANGSSATLDGAVVYSSLASPVVASTDVDSLPSMDSSVAGTEYFNGLCTGSASCTMVGNVAYSIAGMAASGSATSSCYLVINPPIPPVVVSPVTGGVFRISYNTNWDFSLPPIFETTSDLPYNASVLSIRTALEDLPSIYPESVNVFGGPLPLYPVYIEFTGAESGFPQSLLVVDSSDLNGGFYEVSRQTAGTTSYSDSESNTVQVNNEAVILSNIPISPDGASRRNIYRKKTEAPYNEWRYVGSIEDNYTSIFIDSIPDSELSEVQLLTIFGTGTYKLRYDSYDSPILSSTSNAADLEEAINIAISGSLGFPIDEVHVYARASTELAPEITTVATMNASNTAQTFCLPVLESSTPPDVYGNMNPVVEYAAATLGGAVEFGNSLACVATASTELDPYPNFVTVTSGETPGTFFIKFDKNYVAGKDVPQMEIVSPKGVTGYIITTGPRALRELSTAFTYAFQKLVEYIYVTKPAHLRIRELRSAAFRASINSAGDPV